MATKTEREMPASEGERRHFFGHGRPSNVQVPAINVRESSDFHASVFGWEVRGGSDHHLSFTGKEPR